MMSKIIKGTVKSYLIRADGGIWSEEQFWTQFIDTVLQVQKVPPRLQMKWSKIFRMWSKEKRGSFSSSVQKSVQIYFHLIRRKVIGETGPKFLKDCEFVTPPIVEKMHQFLSFTGASQSQEPSDESLPKEQSRSGDEGEEEKNYSEESFIAPLRSTFIPSSKRDRKQFETNDVRFMKEQLYELQVLYDNVIATAYGRTCQILTSNGNMRTRRKMRFSATKDGNDDVDNHHLQWALREFQELRRELIALVKEATHTISFSLKKDA